MNLYAHIAAVPDVIWSGVIASILALSGVFVSNWSNNSRLNSQLKHDSEEKARDRKNTLRREVYLRMAEELVNINAYLATLPQLDTSVIDPSAGLREFMIVSAKLQLISDVKNSLLVSDLGVSYGEVFMKLLIKARPIHEISTDIAIRNINYERNQAEVTRVLAAMAQFTESVQTDMNVFDALQKSFDFHQGVATSTVLERNRLVEQKTAMVITFSRELFAEMKPLGEKQIRVLAGIRRELELEGDVNEFMSQMNILVERVNAQMNIAFDALEKKTTVT